MFVLNTVTAKVLSVEASGLCVVLSIDEVLPAFKAANIKKNAELFVKTSQHYDYKRSR